jgi:DNA polymerase
MSGQSGRAAAFLAEMGIAPLWNARAGEPATQALPAARALGRSQPWPRPRLRPPVHQPMPSPAPAPGN